MKLYKTRKGHLIEFRGKYYLFNTVSWDELVNDDQLYNKLEQFTRILSSITKERKDELMQNDLMAPIGSQEVWASGVTYHNSKLAREEESLSAGGNPFYSRVYNAARPELFFKSAAFRVAGHKDDVFIRRDSEWNVPEPELTLMISSSGKIVAYTIGNDMSSRSIEGENPLYLPQAKCYDNSAAIGPSLLIVENDLITDAEIKMSVSRGQSIVYHGETNFNRIKRTPVELVQYLYRETSFPTGCLLMTGTGIIPDKDFTLQGGDEIQITIEQIGTLINTTKYRA